ncbi:MAG: GH92 family glycosyl hydrolase [Kiritimatiellia bacterium]
MFAHINPEIGTISHMLVPVFPVIQRPHGMMRLVPPNKDPRSLTTDGLSLLLTSHRGWQAFRLLPLAPDSAPTSLQHIVQSQIRPDVQSFTFLESQTTIEITATEHAAFLRISFLSADRPHRLLLAPRGTGHVMAESLDDSSLRISATDRPLKHSAYSGFFTDIHLSGILSTPCTITALDSGVLLEIPAGIDFLTLRYAVSYLDSAQAADHLATELPLDIPFESIASNLKSAWSETIGKIEVEGGTEDDKTVFATALFRCRERPIRFSEKGRYFSGYDGKIHEDGGIPFWCDDWTWDTYRALHPLNCLLEPKEQRERLLSLLCMAEQAGCVPTFPAPFGDLHAMLGFHPASLFLEGFRKGLLRKDEASQALLALHKTFCTRSLVPWVNAPPTALDDFFWKHGFFPSLRPGETETIPEVNPGERRQSVSAILDLSFDFWCCAELAADLDNAKEETFFRPLSKTIRNLWKPDTAYFHPKDSNGNWIKPVDYTLGGGQGARDFYAENSGHIYAWGAPHDLDFIISGMGGPKGAEKRLDKLFDEAPPGALWDFLKLQPDATGLVGQYAMGNEPCLHIPYIYNRIGVPWKTQLRTRQLLRLWWRNDLMGVCGDDDGGGLSSWCIFTMMGLYPFLPGSLQYELTSPVFRRCVLHQPGRNPFTILAPAASKENKFIQAVRLNGKEWNETSIPHSAILDGGTLEFALGPFPSSWCLR